MTPGLVETARALVGAGRGLLAMDESSPTCDKRFAAAGIPQTEEMSPTRLSRTDRDDARVSANASAA